ncbi:type II toxin-antitoxin system RelE/ParE family toxin [Sorangium sp. So ce296]|uniref:type II toxin-antitoxin system RelE/ParE family toxin n=1 Tax=Sorangium sp. So ce296 TaxID=3133296 RepID=UPI003F5D6FCB
MRAVLVRPAAAADIARAYAWYERERDGLGEEFLTEVRAAMQAAVEAPMAYEVLHRQTRRVLVRRFPYGLFFRLMNGVVVFVACFHTRRRPESWTRRR